MATAGARSARKSAPSRAACDACRARARKPTIAAAHAPAPSRATRSGARGTPLRMAANTVPATHAAREPRERRQSRKRSGRAPEQARKANDRGGRPDRGRVQQHEAERDGEPRWTQRMQREVEQVERRVGDERLKNALVCPQPRHIEHAGGRVRSPRRPPRARDAGPAAAAASTVDARPNRAGARRSRQASAR